MAICAQSWTKAYVITVVVTGTLVVGAWVGVNSSQCIHFLVKAAIIFKETVFLILYLCSVPLCLFFPYNLSLQLTISFASPLSTLCHGWTMGILST